MTKTTKYVLIFSIGGAGLILLIVVAVIALALFQFGTQNSNGTEQASGTSCLAITPTSGEADADTGYGTSWSGPSGTMTNNCGRAFRQVRLEYKFYDSDGAVAGRGMALDSAGLEPGEKYRFKIDKMDDVRFRWKNFKLINVETW